MKAFRFFILGSILLVVMLLGFSVQAHAALQNLGVDIAGNRLIYDSDLDITWYDYSNSAATWQDQVDWADALPVNFGGNFFDGWRLPETPDGELVNRVDGTGNAGLNMTNSEMAHLFYVELENLAMLSIYDEYQPDYGLQNTGDFQNLQAGLYWSGTEAEYAIDPGSAWDFGFNYGTQYVSFGSLHKYGLAVHQGNVASEIVSSPEPVSSALFLVGGAVMGFRRLRK